MSQLEIFADRTRLVLQPGEVARVGRDPALEIPVVHDLASRLHARIRYDDGWLIEDLGSTNGIYHRGEQATTIPLADGDEVFIGDPETGARLRMRVTQPIVTPSWSSTAASSQSVPPEEQNVEHTRLVGARAQPFRSIPRPLSRLDPSTSVLTLGSAPDNDIVLDDVFVSRHHVRVAEADGGFLVDDLNSLNGTFVNGQLVSSAYLREGDRLTLGNSDFVRVAGSLVAARQTASEGGLSIRGLGFALRGGKRLLHDIDLDAARGTLTAVIGPSGAGKSTFSRVVTGVAPASAGTVQFDDLDVHRDYEAVNTRIGLVPQDDVLHRSLTVRNALGYAAKLRLPADVDAAGRRRQVARAVDQLGLQKHVGTRVDKLSGGQRKRASVALELLTEPALLVLDEPTSGLDPALDQQVMQTLRELADGGRAVLVITHSVAYLDICDQVLVLAPGGLPAYVGPAAGIAAHFGTEDWAVIFSRLADDPAGSHASYRARVGAAVDRPRPVASPRPIRPHRVPWLRQFTTLFQRQLNVIVSDAGYLAFLVALPVVLGVLTLAVPGHRGFTTPEPKSLGEPSQLLALLVVGACFIGSSMSIRDLVGERAIYLRERAVGLSPLAYLASKVAVFGLFSWASAAILTVIAVTGKEAPTHSLITGSGSLDLFLALGATATCCALLGLAISSLVRSSEQAMPLLVVILMAQLVLHGGIIPVTGRAVLDQVSWLVPARWGFAAAASSTDLLALVPTMDHDALWKHQVATWWGDIAVIGAFALVFAAITFLRVRASRR